MEKNMANVKISFIGDIMCEKPLLNAALKNDNTYDFDSVFCSMKKVFMKSDYIVGNLETVCAGEKLGYTNHIYSFNTPEEFIKSIKNSGVDLVTTATNHCLDRGVEGLKNNLATLKKYKLDNIGTHDSIEEREQVFVKDFNGIKVAFLNYTYGTNTLINEVILNKNERFHVNLLKPQCEEIKKLEKKLTSKSLKSRIARTIFKIITVEQWIRLKRTLGLAYKKAYQDDSLEGIDQDYLEQIKLDIQKAKAKSDFVIMCMHSGGQFNVEPGKFSKFMMNFMKENGVNVVVGNHPHIVQKCERFSTGMIGAYSLGNFSISPSSVYILHENLPEYSIMMHIYLEKNKNNIRLSKATFSILKIIESKNHNLTVYPVIELIKKAKDEKEKKELINDVTIIYNRFLNKNIKNIEIRDEFIIE
ncbi:CapA family protein [Siminovitchia sp. 179-K 8D1 HS]|uniref:CapA family protein n=1 Tax=Siminovitchia sp. 179-K 8D1 HS TaxID=3142385 RepID=UPI0039A15B2F